MNLPDGLLATFKDGCDIWSRVDELGDPHTGVVTPYVEATLPRRAPPTQVRLFRAISILQAKQQLGVLYEMMRPETRPKALEFLTGVCEQSRVVLNEIHNVLFGIPLPVWQPLLESYGPKTDRYRDRKRQKSKKKKHWKGQPPQDQEVPTPAALFTQGVYEAWDQRVKEALDDLAGMTVFPQPPGDGECKKPTCKAASELGRKLTPCECQVETAILAVGRPRMDDIRRWHPDRFSRCHVDFRVVFKDMAGEMCATVLRIKAHEDRGQALTQARGPEGG
ncbi:hypothetical protein LTR17_022027 [Elasticomyces elasticus]|nr:hypothetical protein LTR17_022027 [Elasticomyces elasticus]